MPVRRLCPPYRRSRSLARRGFVGALAAALHVVARTTMAAPAAVQRKAIRLVVVAVRARLRLLRRLLRAGDEGRQPIDIAAVRGRVALVLLARLIGLVLLLRERLRVARDVGLRLACPIRRFALTASGRLLVVAVIEALVAGARHVGLGTHEVRVVLAELLLRRGDHAIIVLGVLVVVFGGDRIAGGLRVTRQLNVFFRNV